MLYATHSTSERNVGVGGIPAIRFIQEGVLYRPGESQSKLAQEVVVGTRKGYLPKGFAKKALRELILGDGDFEKIEAEMMKKATRRATEFNRMLRGYRV